MHDETLPPLFANIEPGRLFKVREAARLLADASISEDTMASQIRSFAQRRLVHVRGQRGTGPTAHNLFAGSDLAAAKVLSMLTSDLSLSDNKILEAASRSLYFWKETDPRPRLRATPVLAALTRTMERSDIRWTFHLAIFRSTESGERKVVGQLIERSHADPARFGLDLEFKHRTSVSIELQPILLRIGVRAFEAGEGETLGVAPAGEGPSA